MTFDHCNLQLSNVIVSHGPLTVAQPIKATDWKSIYSLFCGSLRRVCKMQRNGSFLRLFVTCGCVCSHGESPGAPGKLAQPHNTCKHGITSLTMENQQLRIHSCVNIQNCSWEQGASQGGLCQYICIHINADLWGTRHLRKYTATTLWCNVSCRK